MTYTIVFFKRRARSLKKERDDSYVEYKWKLIEIERSKLIRLTTKMNYRLNEGEGKSIYAVGFTDDGYAIGITKY
jgi:GTPase